MPNVIDLLVAARTSEKAKGKGGFGGLMGKLGYTAPGHGVRDVKKPGSRGGHPWTDANGGVHYGPQPQGRGHSGSASARAKKPAAKPAARSGAGPKKPAAKKPMTAHNHPANFKRQTPEARVTARRKMLTSLNKTYRTGVDPHGNPMNEKQLAQVKVLRAALSGELKAHRAANPPVSKKKEITGEVKAQIATKEQEAKPFTAYKDINGQWRWLIRSSSSFKDRDGETVSQKALEGAAEKLNATGNFGILDWWHTPANLGPCDFSAMHGRVLVESGTFVNEAVGERIAAAIANKSFKPGASLMFAHNEPGPAVLAGRVFNDIQIIQRSLLPEEIASNAATTMEIVNLADSLGQASNKTKEVKRKMDAAKEAKLRELLGPQLVEQFLSGSELAEKQLEMTGLSWKALAPAMDKNAVNAAQLPAAGAAPAIDPTKKKLDTKAAPGDVALVEGSPEEEAAETPEEETAEDTGAFDDSPADDAADALMQGLYDEIDRIVQTRLEAASKDILAALSGVSAAATASKETGDALGAVTLALKENTTAMNAVVAENKSLKARLDALEGKQPAAVRARASQGTGLSAEQLREADKDLVNPAQKEVDPYAKIVEQLGLIPFSKGAV